MKNNTITIGICALTVHNTGYGASFFISWGCAILFNPLVTPPSKGVLAWAKVYHLLQKY